MVTSLLTSCRSRLHSMDPQPIMVTTLLLALAALFSPSLCCSLLPGTKIIKHSMQDIFYQAPLAVTGKMLSMDEDNNLGTFQIYCVFKWDSNGGVVPSEIDIFEAGFVSTCSSRPEMAPGEIWLMSLEKGEDGIYNFYELNVHNSGAYEANSENMQTVANICKVAVQDEVPTGVSFDCPVTNVTKETCYSMTSASVGLISGGRMMNSLVTLLCLAVLKEFI